MSDPLMSFEKENIPEQLVKRFLVESSIQGSLSDEVHVHFKISNINNGKINYDDVLMALSMMTSKLDDEIHAKKDTDNKYEDMKKRNNELEIKIGNVPLLYSKKISENFDSDSDSSRIPPKKAVRFDNMKASRRASIQIIDTTLHDFYVNRDTLMRVNNLRYQENVFRAARKIAKDIPPYPTWSYKDPHQVLIQTFKINVGGEIFEVFKETVMNISRTKIGKWLKSHKSKNMPFIDRDPVCFNAILNFFRTGRLHVPPNVCPSFFEEELRFWGIHDEFLEPCCWDDFSTSQKASNKLKRYSEDYDKGSRHAHSGDGKYSNFRDKVFKVLTSGSEGILSRWVATLCAFFIILAILCMVMSTTQMGRKNLSGNDKVVMRKNESVTKFLDRTEIVPMILRLDFLISGFFLAELLLRLILCPVKLDFFRDTYNWVDVIATMTSLFSAIVLKKKTTSMLETYSVLLKIPRIFRLLKLTANLRSGIDAFVMTLFASARELQLVLCIIMVATLLFGCYMFAIEMLNGDSSIPTIYSGIWWALETLPGVGYGVHVPKSVFGYLIGTLCIMSGVIICQMPVPIFLKNFSVYYNQANARLISQSELLLFTHVDKSNIMETEDNMQGTKVEEKDEENISFYL